MLTAIILIVFLTALFFLVRYWENKSKRELYDMDETAMYHKYNHPLDEFEEKIS